MRHERILSVLLSVCAVCVLCCVCMCVCVTEYSDASLRYCDAMEVNGYDSLRLLAQLDDTDLVRILCLLLPPSPYTPMPV